METKYICFVITDIIRETADAATFVVKADNAAPFYYQPGQFLTLIFYSGSREIRRSYSFSSTPCADDDIRFTVKRVHNGEISRKLLDTYKKGDKLYAVKPAGMFTYNSKGVERDVFFFAAGSGITPVFSMIKHILFTDPAAQVILVYQNTTEASTIFRRQLGELADRYPATFIWIDYVSRAISGPSRKLTNDRLEALIPQLMQHDRNDALFYLCGPLSFMRMCQYTILLMGFRSDQLRKEYFVIDTPPSPPLIEDPAERTVTVHMNGKQLKFPTQYPSSILQSAIDQEAGLPYSCKGGRCSACVARCIKGKVVMGVNDILTDKDIASGLILTCVGYAVTDVEISYE